MDLNEISKFKKDEVVEFKVPGSTDGHSGSRRIGQITSIIFLAETTNSYFGQHHTENTFYDISGFRIHEDDIIKKIKTDS